MQLVELHRTGRRLLDLVDAGPVLSDSLLDAEEVRGHRAFIAEQLQVVLNEMHGKLLNS
ncbi:hypothetical protein ACFQX4_15490 [Roseomonas sp. GCM10028921]